MFLLLNLFHVKDPQNYLYLGRRPPSENMLFHRPNQKQRLDLKTFALKEYVFKDLCHIFNDFSKTADLKAPTSL